ncbi:hypothetical protein Nepgr_001268 [Nepenthes gracilis]|uniref:Uncharacterized protein n=1 Tax=Nepenthes gracilis TaxID=150966 RepID=A0AAD3P450_NEPGR|nr:hypothetical protein Nepgr_001268 [Nepenthes gracilis]
MLSAFWSWRLSRRRSAYLNAPLSPEIWHVFALDHPLAIRSPSVCLFVAKSMGDSSSDTEPSSHESEFGSNALVSSGAYTSGGARSEATVAGPSRSRGIPPGFEGVPPRRGLQQSKWSG